MTTFTPIQLDALKEVGNIGAGHAATALSQMIGKTIYITVSDLKSVSQDDVIGMFGGPDRGVLAVYMRMLGEITGGVLFVLGSKDAGLLVNMLKGVKQGPVSDFADMDQLIIKEAGSLTVASYLRAIGTFLGLSIIPAVPATSRDKAGRLLKSVFDSLTKSADVIICIGTQFCEESGCVNGQLLWIPDKKSMDVIVDILNDSI